ncbi:acyl-CoA thioesterase [Thalassotalea maritima]|uniref:acyl-CoA thioesterase n=1 Tax=Thalassotalea maritima TaxID=3242416 RepID=UPI003527F551
MFHYSLTPGFNDTDALGHINNSKLPVWFENAREPIFRIFTPDLDLLNWPLILAKIEVNFLAQLYYGHHIEIKTAIASIGRSSFVVHHQAWQRDTLCAEGTAVMVNFDYHTQKSCPIPEVIKQQLEQHLLT